MGKPGGVPERVDYRRCAVAGRTIEGHLRLNSMSRVVAAAAQAPAADDLARLRLGFCEDAQRRVHATGRVTARIVLRCQRCSALFAHDIDTAIAGIVVSDDATAATVPRAAEPIMADGDLLDVPALAEDELLLAWPMVPRCGAPACRSRYDDNSVIAAAEAEPESQRSGDNAFSVLKKLQHNNDT